MIGGAIIAARLLQYGGGSVLFGAAMFGLAQSAAARLISPSARRALFASAALLVIVGAGLWLLFEAAMIMDVSITQLRRVDLVAVAVATVFGRACLARVALAGAALGLGSIPDSALAARALVWVSGLLLASFAWTGHGAMDGGAWGALHLGADILHLLAAGLWLGAFAPFLMLLARRPDDTTTRLWRALAGFASTGTLAVATLVVTGIVNSWFLVGPAHVRDVFEMPYGRILLAKLALFAAMLAMAALNRFRLTPSLGQCVTAPAGTPAAISRLRRSIMLEAGLGLLVLLAVSALGTVEPMAAMAMP